MEPRAAAAAAAQRRVKRAMGHLREAARALAPEAGELDLVAELADPSGAEVLEALELARGRYRPGQPLDVLILGATQPAPRPPEPIAGVEHRKRRG